MYTSKKAIWILAGNLNLGRSYFITTIREALKKYVHPIMPKKNR
jgi:hypothetical protein